MYNTVLRYLWSIKKCLIKYKKSTYIFKKRPYSKILLKLIYVKIY